MPRDPTGPTPRYAAVNRPCGRSLVLSLLALGSVACGSTDSARADAGAAGEADAGPGDGQVDAGPGDGQVDAGPACSISFGDLPSSDEIDVAVGPLPCGPPAPDDQMCGVYQVEINPAPGRGPIGNPDLNAVVEALPVLLVVQAKDEEALCRGRWIVFDAGGFGAGYGPTFGGSDDAMPPPGAYEPAGAGFGDDLIHRYVDEGYVTVDVVFHCPQCDGLPFDDWADEETTGGTGWYRETGGAGYLASSTRTRAVYEWARALSGRSICAHAQSSGSGRLAGVLTRFGVEDLFDTVVFDGGPVFAYVPYMCGTADDHGPLGDPPEFYARAPGDFVRSTWDCAASPDNDEACSVDDCRRGVFDPWMLDDSHFTAAATLDFPSLDMAVVFGGRDHSDAWQHVQLWLRGDDSVGFTAGLSARSLTLHQGYCASVDDTWCPSDACRLARPCTDWDPAGFDGVATGTTIAQTHDERLVSANHDLSREELAADVLFDVMTTRCGVE